MPVVGAFDDESATVVGGVKAMKFLRLILLVALIGWNTAAQQSRETSNAQAISSQGTYVITTHDSVPQKDFLPNAEVYTIEHGAEILKVTYSMSQTHSGKQGEFEPTGIHLHFSERDPDLSQIPPLGMKIHACLMTKVFGRTSDRYTTYGSAVYGPHWKCVAV